MPRIQAANNTTSTLAASIDAVQTSFTVSDASKFPDAPFRLSVDNEIMEVGAIDRPSNTFSQVLRAQENTPAAPHNAGVSVENRFTAGTYAELAAVDANNRLVSAQLLEDGITISALSPVAGAEITAAVGVGGPAAEFADGATQSGTESIVWPIDGKGLKAVAKYSMDTANAGSVRLQVGYSINGAAVTNVAMTVTPGADTIVHTADLGTIIAAGSLHAGDLLAITISRLGADALDTHTGKFRLYHLQIQKVVA